MTAPSLPATKKITLVAAMGRNQAIGMQGRMPWHLPAELKHFKATTLGKPVVMGRKTWESIGRLLPGRQNLVISRNPQLANPGFDLCDSLQQAIDRAEGDEVMIIGGGELYRQALPLASRLVLTQVDCEPPADTYFPAWDPQDWELVSQVHVPADGSNQYACDISEWQRPGQAT